MRHIDAFCHFFPASLFEQMSQTAGGTRDIGKRMQGVRTIYDLDARLQDDGRVRRLLARSSRSGCRRSKRMAGPDAVAGVRPRRQRRPRRAVRQASRSLRRLGGRAADERARRGREGGRAHPRSTATPTGCSSTPTSTAPASTSRASFRSSRSRPSRASRCCCIRRAPRTSRTSRPRPNRNTRSGRSSAGPTRPAATMARLIFSGVTTRLPNLKILIHHLGAMIPFFDARLDTGWATLGSRTSDEDYSGVLQDAGQAADGLLPATSTPTPRSAAAASARSAGSNSTAPTTCCSPPTRRSAPRAAQATSARP